MKMSERQDWNGWDSGLGVITEVLHVRCQIVMSGIFRVMIYNFCIIVRQPKHDFLSNLAVKVPQWVLIDLIS